MASRTRAAEKQATLPMEGAEAPIKAEGFNHLHINVRDLARSIARDGEGATKLISVKVLDAATDDEARIAARAVASSSLVKTAVHGGDPNWGRIVCALGYSGAELALDKLHLTVGGLVVFERGSGVDVDLAAVDCDVDTTRDSDRKPSDSRHGWLPYQT